MDRAVTGAVPHLRDTSRHQITVIEIEMKLPEMERAAFDAAEWDKRRRNNKRLGYLVAVIVVMIFLGSIWKYRPF